MRVSKAKVALLCAATGVALTIVGAAFGNAAAAQSSEAPAFIASACDLPKLTAAERPRLRCGTVSVPRDYAHPSAGQFKLAVVAIRSARHPALPDPLVYISGGPGSPLTVYTYYQATHPVAPGRDLILVDQRGIGQSEPTICPGHRDEVTAADTTAAIEPNEQTMSRRSAAYAACRDEAAARGIDLRDFGTVVTAEDFNTVRQALGVQRWNVFGVSYGTTVAMTLMARHPATIRAAVLDSVYPPDPILPPWSADVADARRTFLASCASDAACAKAYPDLAGLYESTMRQLDQRPLSVAVPARMQVPGSHVPVTASLFELVIGHMVYYPNFYAELPRLIAAVHDGDTTAFSSGLESLLGAATDQMTGTNFVAHAAVDCRDRPSFHKPLGEGADIFERTSLHGLCDIWSELGPPPVIPRDTEVPTLVLSGQFDPNARPATSLTVAALIGNHATWVEFVGMGHSVRAFSPCAARITAEFIAHPARALDTSCAGHPAPVHYLPRDQRR